MGPEGLTKVEVIKNSVSLTVDKMGHTSSLFPPHLMEQEHQATEQDRHDRR